MPPGRVRPAGCRPCPFPPRHRRRPAWTCRWRPAAVEPGLLPVPALPARGGTGLGQSSLLNRLAERVELEAQVLGDFSSAPAGRQQLLCSGRDLRRHHRGTASRTRRVERLHAAGAILVDAPNDAVLRDAEGPHDVHLAAGALADQLGGKHPEGAVVTLGVIGTPAGRRRSRSIGHFRARR